MSRAQSRCIQQNLSRDGDELKMWKVIEEYLVIIGDVLSAQLQGRYGQFKQGQL